MTKNESEKTKVFLDSYICLLKSAVRGKYNAKLKGRITECLFFGKVEYVSASIIIKKIITINHNNNKTVTTIIYEHHFHIISFYLLLRRI